ncbi:MAG TPA: DUF4118 domain-containing protein [Streptosporangiaceae bacterium]|nr:DUF4118 domain-containing protein [Streptosporangiaceae bacterium]
MWLILSAIVLRMTFAMAAVVFLGAVFLLAASEQFLACAGSGLPLQRKVAGHALAAAFALFLTLLLATWRGRSPTVGVLAFVLAVIVVALVGGFVPAVLEAVAGSLLLHFVAMAQPGTFTIGGVGDLAVLGVLVAVAAVVGFGVEEPHAGPGRQLRRPRQPGVSQKPTAGQAADGPSYQVVPGALVPWHNSAASGVSNAELVRFLTYVRPDGSLQGRRPDPWQ